MIGSTRQARIWVSAEPVNMRKSFDGLSAVARNSMGRDPLCGDMFLFIAANRKQARVLFWDGTGFIIIAKRLEAGRFNAPWQGDTSRPWQLTEAELALFLEGSRLAGHFELSPRALSYGSAVSN